MKNSVKIVSCILISLILSGCNLKTQDNVEYGDIAQCSMKQVMDMIHYDSSGKIAAKNSIVAVIDTKYNLSEIQDGVLWVNHKEVSDNNIDEDKNGYIDDIYGWNFVENTNNIQTKEFSNHGTMILNVIDDYGIEIMPITVLDDDGNGTTNSIIKAIKYAEKNGADICNLSIATYEDNKELEKVICESDMLFVVAAGNGGEELDIQNKCYPACYSAENMITVAACDLDYNIIENSNFGVDYVDLAVTGDCVGITLENGEETVAEGTSFATAVVTRAVAFIRNNISSKFDAKDMKKLILNTVSKNEKLKGKVRSSGIININRSMERLQRNNKEEMDNY